MATLTIGDRKVTVDDAFLSLSPEEQNATVEEIAASLSIGGASQPSGAPKSIDDLPDITEPGNPLYGQRHGGSFVTGIIDGLGRAITTPREVYEGKIDLNTQEGADRAIETALTVNPAVPSGLIRTAPAAVAVPKASSGVAEAAQNLGINAPRGITSDSKIVQSAFQRGRQVPGATSVIDNSLDDFYRGVETKVDEVASQALRQDDKFSTRSTVQDRTELGASVRSSLEKAIERSDEASEQAFKVMRRAIDPEQRVDALTDDAAKTLNSIMANRTGAGESAIASQLEPAFKILTDPDGVSFSGLQRARSQVGRAIKWDESRGGFNAGDLKQAYSALTNSMERAVRQSAKTSPEGAVKLWKAADARFEKMIGDNKVLSSVLRKEADESLVSSIVGMASAKTGNARKLEQVLREMGPQGRDEVSGFVIQGLGQGRDGNFSPLAFSNNWGKLSPTGKAQLFRDAEVRRSLEDLAKLTERMADAQKRFANSSNTSGALGLGALGAGLVADPFTTVATVVGANAVARVLAKPAVAKAAANYAKAAKAAASAPGPTATKMLEKARVRLLEAAEKAAILSANDNSAQAAVSGGAR